MAKNTFSRPLSGTYNLNPELMQRLQQIFSSPDFMRLIQSGARGGGPSPVGLTNTAPGAAGASAPQVSSQATPTPQDRNAAGLSSLIAPKPTAPPAPDTPTAAISQPSKLPTGATTSAPSAIQQLITAIVAMMGGGQGGGGGLDQAIAHGLVDQPGQPSGGTGRPSARPMPETPTIQPGQPPAPSQGPGVPDPWAVLA